jgi:phenylacetic acid degradation operon negative regulatory protein
MSDTDTLSAPELVLSLADSVAEPRLSAASLVAAAALLGIDPGAVRVAVARLVKQGILEQRERGIYHLGQRGGGLHRRVQAWAQVEDQLVRWDGRWLAVLTAHLGRSDKAGLRARERALRLRGFATARSGLAVRPANLAAHLPALRGELVELGLHPDALLVRLDEADPDHPFDPAVLWDVASLERGYADNCTRLAASTARLAELDVQSAARESLLVGRAVMRDILTDPLLPASMVDAAARRRMIDAMRAYDRLGKACWRRFQRSLPA